MEGKGDTLDHRRAFYVRQVERYGYDVVGAWLESLPLKLKKWDFIESNQRAGVYFPGTLRTLAGE